MKKDVLIMLSAFRDGGFFMIPTTVIGLLLLAASIRYAMSPERRFIPLQISLGIMTLTSGVLGFVMGAIKSFSALPKVSVEDRWIWTLGIGESLNNLALAFAVLTLAAMAASIGAGRIARQPNTVSAQ